MVKVTLLGHTPQPQTLVAAAAKLCYSSSGIDTLMQGLDDEKSADFVAMLGEIGHESPIEHASFTFGIEGVSRSFLAQITRHRIASYSVQSQRYVREKQFEFIIPPQIKQNPDALAIYMDTMKQSEQSYAKITDILTEQNKQAMIANGTDEKTATKNAEKKSIEDARFVLPNACETKMVVTMNARSLMNFFTLRCCNRAQWEIRQAAVLMLQEVYKVAPDLFATAGPACVRGACSEGKMTCGKINEVRNFFKELKGQL
ncbi:MAG: FAD-dependent thymidylate synthase [Oscillospiraceae bacterium]